MGSHTIIARLFLLVAIISCATGEIYFKKGSPHVKLSNNALLSGKVEQSREGRPFNSFVGIPYGRIPERFREAEPAPACEGTYDAVKPGHACVQPHWDDTGKPTKVGEEDCLNLNVYVPMNNTQRSGGYNVMVWIHGGGFLVGTGLGYGGKYFMDEDVILVTINYRLGVFGFLSTGDSVIPGNNGLKDQVLALRWVQDNIKHFGGDPGKVTIFGESAGSASVHYQMLSPTTTGLFKSAISQSNTALSPWAYQPNPKTVAVNFANHLKCAGTSSQEILTCLKGFTAEELNEAQFVFSPRWPKVAVPFDFGPVKEDTASPNPFLSKSPWEIVFDKSVPHKEIPWMIGITEDEGCSLYSGAIFKDQSLLDELNSNWKSVALRAYKLEKFVLPEEKTIVAEKIRKFYFGDKPISTENRQSLTNLYSDSYFVQPVRKAAIEMGLKGKKTPVYLYQYAHLGPASAMHRFGFPVADEELKQVGHGDELFLQFNMDSLFPDVDDLVNSDSVHADFSKHLVKLWTSFAIHGKPKYSWGSSTDVWRPISRNELEGKSPLKWYRINSNPGYIEEQTKDNALFWEKLCVDHLLHSVLPSASKAQKTEL